MRRILKYPLKTDGGIIEIRGPVIRVLKIKNQNGRPMIWIEMDESLTDVVLLIASIGTGWKVSSNLQNWRYIDTEFEDEFVWHFYGKVLNEEEEEILADFKVKYADAKYHLAGSFVDKGVIPILVQHVQQRNIAHHQSHHDPVLIPCGCKHAFEFVVDDSNIRQLGYYRQQCILQGAVILAGDERVTPFPEDLVIQLVF